MPTTARAGLRSPALTDLPNVPQDIGFLAVDTDGQLFRAFPCTSTTRPTSVGIGFQIWETDTGAAYVWNGTAWAVPANFGGTVSGGGGGTPTPTAYVFGQWSEDDPQSIPFNTNTAIRFSDTDVASSAVTRASDGSGHRFTVSQTGLYAVSITVRFAEASETGGNRYLELRNSGGSIRHAATAAPGAAAQAATLHLAEPAIQLSAGDTLLVIGAQTRGAGTALFTQPVAGSSPVRGWQQIRITKVG